jgi:hypothetical protein
MKEFLCFIHIEKCAGTTVNTIIADNLPFYTVPKPAYWTNDTNSYFTNEELERLLKLIPLVNGIGGHVVRCFLNYKDCVKKPIFYFTFLREPISRYMSHFNYQRLSMDINWNLADFINEPKFNNYQTVKIAGREDSAVAIDILKKDIKFTGLMEKFDESLLILKKLINRDFNVNYRKANVLLEKKQINPENVIRFETLDENVQKKILDNNALDIELYSFAKSHFYEKYFPLIGDSLTRELDLHLDKNVNYKRPLKNRILNRLYRKYVYGLLEPKIRSDHSYINSSRAFSV